MKLYIKKYTFFSLVASIISSGSVFAISPSDPFPYTIQDGDTIAKIASQYNLDEDVIRYYNTLNDDADIIDGIVTTTSRKSLRTLMIKPLWGSIIESQKNNTLTSLGRQYVISVRELLLFNSLSVNEIIEEGTEIFLPYYDVRTTDTSGISRISKNGGMQIDLSVLSRKTAEDAVGKFISFLYDEIDSNLGTLLSTRYQKGIGAGGFVAGQCTDYAASRRPDLFPSRSKRLFGGNAKDRYVNAKKAGIPVGKIPKKGAIAVFTPGKGGHKIYGHVAIVEKVSEDGKIEITDMNFKGLNIITRRIIDADLPGGYIYKIDK